MGLSFDNLMKGVGTFAPIVGGIGNVLSGLFSNSANKSNTMLSYRLQQDQINAQNRYNYKMWQENNNYNSPKAQMQRFRDAGLNPYIMSGQITPGVAQSAPNQSQTAVPNFQPNMPVDYGSLGAGVSASVQNMLNYRQAEANIKKTEADARVSSANADKLDLEVKYLEPWLSDRNDEQYYKAQNENQKGVEIYLRSKLLEDEYKNLRPLTVKKLKQEVDKEKVELDILNFTKDKLLPLQEQEARERINVLLGQVKNLYLTGQLTKQQCAYYFQQTEYMKLQVAAQGLDNKQKEALFSKENLEQISKNYNAYLKKQGLDIEISLVGAHKNKGVKEFVTGNGTYDNVAVQLISNLLGAGHKWFQGLGYYLGLDALMNNSDPSGATIATAGEAAKIAVTKKP